MKFVIIKTATGDRQAHQRTLKAHLEYLDGLRRRGILTLAGTYEDRSGGLIFVDVSDMEEAVTIAREDPQVRAGVHRYQVKPWRNAAAELSPREDNTPAPLDAVESGPLIPPTEEEDIFRVVEAGSSQEHTDNLVRCLAPEQIALDHPVRLSYLRQARDRGLQKLLLFYGNQLAGQVEFATCRGSGLPVQGEEVAVINCIWVLDAFTGLSGARRLLAACSERTRAQSLVTIAYNDHLPWMPASFFRSQGFSTLEQVETGRFYENTSIVAHLMWRPLVDDAPCPTWDPARLLAGLDFCPAYPWLYGKRLYWGRRFSYTGVLVKEGLRRPEILNQFPILGSRRGDNWTMVKVGVPEADLSRAVKLIQSTLIEEPTYFAHLIRDEELIIIFPDRIFTTRKGDRGLREAVQYGLEKGIPAKELDFSPIDSK